MELRLKIVSILIGLLLMVFIINLVRTRKLREEYSFLWLSMGAMVFLLAVWPNFLIFISRLIGVIFPVSTLFFFGLLFLILISLHYSIKISALTNQVKDLAQEIALLKNRTEELEEG